MSKRKRKHKKRHFRTTEQIIADAKYLQNKPLRSEPLHNKLSAPTSSLVNSINSIDSTISFKRCANCKLEQNILFFTPDKRTTDGYSKICISCNKKFSYGYDDNSVRRTPPRKDFIKNPDGKKCSKCRKTKAYSKFRLRNEYAFQGQCKKCQHKREVERRSNFSPEQKVKQLEYQRAYRKTEHGKEIVRKADRKYYQKNKERVNARTAVRYAVMSGRLPHVSTLTCSKCENKAENYHHHKGYKREFWLDVVPVCIKCHRKIKETKAIYQTKQADYLDHPADLTIDQPLEHP